MNYLAHLHLASVTNTSLVGAVLGDFVKGRAHLQLGENLCRGVVLHRKIDSYTDESSYIRSAKRIFAPKQRRLAGIALDVYWDHCLAREFSVYSEEPLSVFVERAYRELSSEKLDFGHSYNRVVRYMVEYDWLSGYADFEGFTLAIQGLSRRRAFLASLVDCIPRIEESNEELTALFSQFYPKLLQRAQQWVRAGDV